MHPFATTALFAACVSAGILPRDLLSFGTRASTYCDDLNPFHGKQITPDPYWINNMNGAYNSFISDNDTVHAAKVQDAQTKGATFFWASNIAWLSKVDDAITSARATRKVTHKPQVAGIVVYDIPSRDCSAGLSSGELTIANDGLNKYKNDYILPMKKKLAAAPDVHFVLVIEPDALANMLTYNTDACTQAKPVYEEGIAFAIAELQLPNVSLYLDVGNSGFLGLFTQQVATEAALIMSKAKALNKKAKIRGFATNVSNYNPFQANAKHPGKNASNKPVDESTYINMLTPLLAAQGLPTKFITDQGRIAMAGVVPGSWCNVNPASFGPYPGTVPSSNPNVDSLLWIKPPGNSDGACGYPGAPNAGTFFVNYAKLLITNADF